MNIKINTSKEVCVFPMEKIRKEIIRQSVFFLILQFVSLLTIKAVLIDVFSSGEFLLFRDSLNNI